MKTGNHPNTLPGERTGWAASGNDRSAFSLLELMVVMAIIGLLATMGLPALKGIGQSNALSAGTRQLLDDLSYARLQAINSRSTVYMVFVPTNFFAQSNVAWFTGPNNVKTDDRIRAQATNIVNYQYSGYAIMTRRSLGDQPGHPNPKYLVEWRKLPDGVFIAPTKFRDQTQLNYRDWSAIPDIYARPFAFMVNSGLPFPAANAPKFQLPYIAFNSYGQLVRESPYLTSFRDEVIPLARGSIFYPTEYDPAKKFTRPSMNLADVQLNPPMNPLKHTTYYTNYHYVRINWMSGRARVEKPEIQ